MKVATSGVFMIHLYIYIFQFRVIVPSVNFFGGLLHHLILSIIIISIIIISIIVIQDLAVSIIWNFARHIKRDTKIIQE